MPISAAIRQASSVNVQSSVSIMIVVSLNRILKFFFFVGFYKDSYLLVECKRGEWGYGYCVIQRSERPCGIRIVARVYKSGGYCLFRFFHAFVNKEPYDENADSDEHIEDLVAIHLHFFDELVFGYDRVEPIPDSGQYDIPAHGAQSGEENEFREFHACQPCGNGDKLAYTREKPADEGRYTAVLVEIAFGGFDFPLVE